MAQVAPSDPAPVLDRPNPPTPLSPSPDFAFGAGDHPRSTSYNPRSNIPVTYTARSAFAPDFDAPDMAVGRSAEPASTAAPVPEERQASEPSHEAETSQPSSLQDNRNAEETAFDEATSPQKAMPPTESASSIEGAAQLPQSASHPQSPDESGLVASFEEININQHISYGHGPQIQMMPMQPQSVLPMMTAQHPVQLASHPQHHPRQQPHHGQHQPHHHQQLLHHQPSTHHLWVPQERVGAVIGGHGAVIRSLQERSGATIQVHNDTVRGDQKLFTIFGTFPQYDIAKQLINDIVEKPRQGHSSSSHGGGHSASDRGSFSPLADVVPRTGELWKKVFVPTSCVGLVIGRNGETIRNLQDRSGADIKVTPDEDATPGAEMRSIHISGTDEAIATAHQLVSEIVMDARSRRPPQSGPHVGTTMNGQPIVFEVLSVPNEKVGLIIGKRGAAIRDLQMKSGAKIQVSKDDSSIQSDGSRPLTITGIRAHVDEAKTMIANKINIPLQPSPVNTSYNNAAQAGASGVASPSVASPSGPYIVPGVYEHTFQNGQVPFQPLFDPSDPNAQSRASMAYFHFMGFGNYAAIAQQQRQFQSQMSLQYGHPQHSLPQGEQQGLQPRHLEQGGGGQPPYSQVVVTPGEDGLQAGSGMIQRDANGNVLVYPSHYQQAPHHLGGHQMYSSAPTNSRMFPRREHVYPAHAQMLMQAHAHAQAQAQSQAQSQAQEAQAHAQARAQTHSQAEGDALHEEQNRPQPPSPPTPTPPEEDEGPNG